MALEALISLLNSNPAREEREIMGMSKEQQASGLGDLLKFGIGNKQPKTELDQLEREAIINKFKDLMSMAIKRAENNPDNHGVLSVETDNPEQVLINSVNNNLDRFFNGEPAAPWIKERPDQFIEFMGGRWAPIGAENDPDNLNENWIPNVRSIIEQNATPEELELFKNLNLF